MDDYYDTSGWRGGGVGQLPKQIIPAQKKHMEKKHVTNRKNILTRLTGKVTPKKEILAQKITSPPPLENITVHPLSLLCDSLRTIHKNKPYPKV